MIRRALGNTVEGILLVMMVLLCADVFLGVFSRYVMGRTFTWYDEIARLLFVWIVFLGAAVGVKRAQGVGKVATAVNGYAEHFDHAGFKPIAELQH